jgi:hypothetical protein
VHTQQPDKDQKLRQQYQMIEELRLRVAEERARGLDQIRAVYAETNQKML